MTGSKSRGVTTNRERFSRLRRFWRALAISFVVAGAVGLATGAVAPGEAQDPAGEAWVLTVDGPIGPAVAGYLISNIENASGEAGAIVMRMDTPGGLDTSMRDINRAILASDVPVIGYVGPPGARAASAGTYMLYATHVAAMAPGTNLGAATPVQMGGGGGGAPEGGPSGQDDGPGQNPQPGVPANLLAVPDGRGGTMSVAPLGGLVLQAEEPAADEGDTAPAEETATDDAAADDAIDVVYSPDEETADESAEGPAAPSNAESMRNKAVNDAVAYIKGLAELRGRNVDWAERAVREAATLTYSEALEQNVIEIVAADIETLLDEADGMTVTLQDGREVVLATADLEIVEVAPTWAQDLLAVITDPNIAFLLLNLGFIALLASFYQGLEPITAIVGLFCLIVGFYALNTLPVNYAGAALILLGLALMISEAFFTSYGVLAISGLVSFAVGAIMLIDTDVEAFKLDWAWIVGVTAGMGGGIFLILTYGLAAQARKVVSGAEDLIGLTGRVVRWNGNEGYVVLDGERWHAKSDRELSVGDTIKAVRMDGLDLIVAPAADAPVSTGRRGRKAKRA